MSAPRIAPRAAPGMVVTERPSETPADFNRLTYREVRSPQLRNVLDDEYWPEDIRGYRDHLKRGDGVPLWLIVLGNKVVEEEFGAAAWRSKILPRISFALRQAPPIRAEFPGMGAHSH